MTTLEALNVEVNNQVLSEKNLILIELDPSAVYSVENNDQVELAKAYCFKSLATQPDWSEDGLTIKYSRSQLIDEANRIFELNDLTDEIINGSPKLSDSSGLW